MDAETADMHCIACRGPLTFFGPREGYAYHRCTACGTIQLVPVPTAEALERAYAETYADAGHYEGDPDVMRHAARPYYMSLLQALRAHGVTGRVVDYGAGWGGLTELLREHALTCEGVEPSEQMAAYCQERGLPVRRGGLNALPDGGVVDALVLCAVFEHLGNPQEVLEAAYGALRPGGLLITLQPTAPFARFTGTVARLGRRDAPLPAVGQTFCPPWHVVFYSLEGMTTLAQRHGFTSLEVRPAPQGRAGGVTGVVQWGLGLVNRVGWPLCGRRWPLLPAHTFVLRKDAPAGSTPA